MADQSNPLTNPGGSRTTRGRNFIGETNPQKTNTNNGNPQDAAQSRFAVDDVNPPGGGPFQVGVGSNAAPGKPFRV